MTEKFITAEEVEPVLQQLVAILNNREQALQGVVIANLVAIFAVNCEGQNPFEIARRIYKLTKANISDNLSAMNLLVEPPKGARPN
jgi:hypothetical protein